MYNSSAPVLAATGGVSALVVGWWAVALISIGILVLLALRLRAQRKRRLALSFGAAE